MNNKAFYQRMASYYVEACWRCLALSDAHYKNPGLRSFYDNLSDDYVARIHYYSSEYLDLTKQ